MRYFKSIFFLLLALLPLSTVLAQGFQQQVKVIVAPEHPDWLYHTGDDVKFNVTVLEYGNPLKNAKIRYTVGPERMDPTKSDSLILKEGRVTIDGGTMKQPGFLRCVVIAEANGRTYRGLATAGFDPLTIKPVAEMPADFLQFWDKAKADLKKIPMDARLTLLPEKCTEKVNVYQVNIQNYRPGTRLYGILCIPKKEGKYPAMLKVPGAGVSSYPGDIAMAERGVITLEIGIHGIPVNMDNNIYLNLNSGALAGYWTYNLEDRDSYYYKRVYMGCVRANDFLTSLPQFDGTNLGVHGGSQGGALSIVTASLDKRVKFLCSNFPALSDLTGYLAGRAGGWPHMFYKANINDPFTKEKIKTAGYYDVVNFARGLTVNGLYTWGFNDETCPPTSMYAAYNVITAPKSLVLYPESGHWNFGEERAYMDSWMHKQLGVN
jgi:cephalosporin-C deacetylase